MPTVCVLMRYSVRTYFVLSVTITSTLKLYSYWRCTYTDSAYVVSAQYEKPLWNWLANTVLIIVWHCSKEVGVALGVELGVQLGVTLGVELAFRLHSKYTDSVCLLMSTECVRTLYYQSQSDLHSNYTVTHDIRIQTVRTFYPHTMRARPKHIDFYSKKLRTYVCERSQGNTFCKCK